MGIGNLILKFTIFYIISAAIVGFIASALKIQDVSIIGMFVIVFVLRHVVSEYMRDYGKKELASDLYWQIFFGAFFIVMAFNIIMLNILLDSNAMHGDTFAIAFVMGTAMNGAAVAAGLFQAKKAVQKVWKT